MRPLLHLLITIGLILCASPAIHPADYLDFKIQDYVPDSYKDVVWQLSGNMSTFGERNGDDAKWTAPSVRSNRNNLSSSRGYLGLDSRIDLFSMSRRSWSRFSGFLSGRIATDSRESLRSKLSLTVSESRTERSEGSQKARASGLYLQTEYATGNYFWNSLAYDVAFTANATLDYRKSLSTEAQDAAYWTIPWRLDSINSIKSIDGASRSNSVYVASTLRLSVGYMYEGRYAAAVLHLLRELEKRGHLRKMPTETDTRILCDTSYAYANKYFADYRWRRVATSTALAETMVNLGLLQSPAGPMLVWIQDVWYGYARESREFGAQLAIGIQANGRSSYHKDDYFVDDIRHIVSHYDGNGDSVVITDQRFTQSQHSRNEYQTVQFDNVLSAIVNRPLSLRWHLKSSVTVQSGIHKFVWDNNLPKQEIDDWEADKTMGTATMITYIADSRTTAGVVGRIQIFHGDDRLTMDDGSHYGSTVKNARLTMLVVSGKLDYWTSDNTKITANCGVVRLSEQYEKERNLHHNSSTAITISLGVTHFLL